MERVQVPRCYQLAFCYVYFVICKRVSDSDVPAEWLWLKTVKLQPQLFTDLARASHSCFAKGPHDTCLS